MESVTLESMTKFSKLFSFVLALILANQFSVCSAQPVMQAGEWRVSVKAETIDNKTAKRAAVGSNSTITICFPREYLDAMGLMSTAMKSYQKKLDKVDIAGCRSAVSEMNAASLKLHMRCSLPNSQSAELDYRFSAETKRYRATNRATRSDGLAAVESAIDGEYVGDCSQTTMVREKDLPSLEDPATLPLVKPSPVKVDGDTFYFAELSNHAAGYENAYTPSGQNVKNFSKYFSVTEFRGVSLESYANGQLEQAERMIVKGAPRPKMTEQADGRRVFVFSSHMNDKLFEMNVILAKASSGGNTMLTQYTLRLDLPYRKHQALIEKKRDAWVAELLALDIPVLTHADFSAAHSQPR
jgi:Protein of unknown function (DUF3617)